MNIDGGAHVITMPVDMDAAAMKAQRAIFAEVTQNPCDMICDMSDVEFIDSSGVSAIVALYKHLAGVGHTLRLRGMQGQPRQLITYLRVETLLMQ